MAETTQIAFSHKEVVQALIKSQDIHEGIWGIYLEFGLAAANIPQPDESFLPAAIVPVTRIGIIRFDVPNPHTVDAAEYNPVKKTKKPTA